MDVLSQNASASSSTLNPNAPMFVPSSYEAVEDFSDQWWDLVHSSPWFRDYWLKERFHDPQFDPFFPENDDPAPLLPDLDSLFDPFLVKQEEEEEEQVRGYNKDLVSLGAAKWRNARVLAEKPRYAEKAPKIVNVKVLNICTNWRLNGYSCGWREGERERVLQTTELDHMSKY